MDRKVNVEKTLPDFDYQTQLMTASWICKSCEWRETKYNPFCADVFFRLPSLVPISLYPREFDPPNEIASQTAIFNFQFTQVAVNLQNTHISESDCYFMSWGCRIWMQLQIPQWSICQRYSLDLFCNLPDFTTAFVLLKIYRLFWGANPSLAFPKNTWFLWR